MVLPLVRPSGQVRNFIEATDVLNARSLDASSAAALNIGTTNATTITIGRTGQEVQFPGTVTLLDSSTLTVNSGTVQFGDGDGDTITLGGAYDTAVDVVNIGTADASGDTDVNLRVDMDVAQDKSVLFDRTADSESVLILPDSDDAPANLATGAVRVNGAGAFQWYNGATWQTAGTSAGNSLQQAYTQGQDILVAAGTGDLQFELTENTAAKHRITTNNALESDYWDYETPAADQLSVNAVLEDMTVTAAGTITMTAPTVDIESTASTINIGANAVAQTINIGTGAVANTLTIGSTNTTTTTTIQSGSGGIALNASGGSFDFDCDDAAMNMTAGPFTITQDGGTNHAVLIDNSASQATSLALTLEGSNRRIGTIADASNSELVVGSFAASGTQGADNKITARVLGSATSGAALMEVESKNDNSGETATTKVFADASAAAYAAVEIQKDNDGTVRIGDNSGTKQFSIQGAAANSGISVTGGDLSVGTVTSGDLRLSAGGDIYLADTSTAQDIQIGFRDSGTHTGADDASVLTDSAQDWDTNELVGLRVYNTTDGSSGLVTANTSTTVTATLSGGAQNDWDTGDAYYLTFVAGSGSTLTAYLDEGTITLKNSALKINGPATSNDGAALIVDCSDNAGIAIGLTGTQRTIGTVADAEDDVMIVATYGTTTVAPRLNLLSRVLTGSANDATINIGADSQASSDAAADAQVNIYAQVDGTGDAEVNIQATDAGIINIGNASNANVEFNIVGNGTASNISVTGGTLGLSTATSGDITVGAAGEITLDDGNRSGSTYSTAMKFTDTSGEWDTFETNFGEVSLINAVNQAYASAGAVGLQDAYEDDNTIAATSANGAIAFSVADTQNVDVLTLTQNDDTNDKHGLVVDNNTNNGASVYLSGTSRRVSSVADADATDFIVANYGTDSSYVPNMQVGAVTVGTTSITPRLTLVSNGSNGTNNNAEILMYAHSGGTGDAQVRIQDVQDGEVKIGDAAHSVTLDVNVDSATMDLSSGAFTVTGPTSGGSGSLKVICGDISGDAIRLGGTYSNIRLVASATDGPIMTIASSNDATYSPQLDLIAHNRAGATAGNASVNLIADASVVSTRNATVNIAARPGSTGSGALNIQPSGYDAAVSIGHAGSGTSVAIAGGSASSFQTTSANLTLGTLTSGTLLLASAGELTLNDQHLSAAIPISESGTTGLDAAFTATSIVGALNELKGGATDEYTSWYAQPDEDLTAGQPVTAYNSGTNGIISVADANDANKKYGLCGVCVTGATTASGDDAEIATTGVVDVTSNASETWSAGDAVYLDTNAGCATTTAPSTSGDVVQRLGWATGDSGATTSHEIVLAIGEPTLV